MFSQRKSFWKRPWSLLIILAILGIGYWFTQNDTADSKPDNPANELPLQIIDNEPSWQSSINPNQNNDNEAVKPDLVNETEKSFFLLKNIDGVIEVYYYEGSNKEPVFIKNADISFSLLSEGDQALFSEGVIVETEEELNELLQDFGS